MGTSTEDSLETKSSLIGEPVEGLKKLASFWLVVDTTFLPLHKLRLLKLKVNHLILLPLSPQLDNESSQKGCLLDAMHLNISFDLLFVFELPYFSSSNLLPNRTLDVWPVSADSQSFNIVLAFLLSDKRDSGAFCNTIFS